MHTHSQISKRNMGYTNLWSSMPSPELFSPGLWSPDRWSRKPICSSKSVNAYPAPKLVAWATKTKDTSNKNQYTPATETNRNQQQNSADTSKQKPTGTSNKANGHQQQQKQRTLATTTQRTPATKSQRTPATKPNGHHNPSSKLGGSTGQDISSELGGSKKGAAGKRRRSP